MISFTYLTLFVDPDMLTTCREWYTSHLGLSVTWESEGFFMLQGDQGAQIGLHAGQPLEQSDQVQLHFKVPDVDLTCALLEEKGVKIIKSPENTAWGYRITLLQDPAGHTVELYHEL